MQELKIQHKTIVFLVQCKEGETIVNEETKIRILDTIAGFCHNLNKAYCESIGDFSQVEWDNAPEEIQASAIKGVLALWDNKLSPKELHEEWKAYKISQGWAYGEIKSFENKTHPLITDYENLPVEQRSKDYIFSSAASQLISLLKPLAEEEI